MKKRTPPVARQLLGEIEGDFAERRVVRVDAHLLGQPPGIRPFGYRYREELAVRVAAEIVDQVVLLDLVLLMLVEQAGHETEALVLRRRDAQFVALPLVAILALDVLRRVGERIAALSSQ